MTGNQTDLVLTPVQQSAAVRTGTVTDFRAQTVEVDVGGATLTAGYLSSYAPIRGDLVAVARQDASWLCLGSLAGYGPNEVSNPSFEQQGILVNTVPIHWNLVNVAGVASMSVVSDTLAPHGGLVAMVNPDAAAGRDAVVYSTVIPVVPGERWDLSAWVAGVNAVGAAVANARLIAIWGVDVTTGYPGVPTETTVQSLTNLGDSVFVRVSGRVTVPATAAVMRVGIRTTPALPANTGVRMDFFTARKVF